MRAAWRSPDAEEGMGRMRKLAEMIERDHPQAAASLREGLKETFKKLTVCCPQAGRQTLDLLEPEG